MIRDIKQHPIPDGKCLSQSIISFDFDKRRRNGDFSGGRHEQDVAAMMSKNPTGNAMIEFANFDLLIEMGLLDEPVADLDQAYTNEFILKAQP